MNVVPYENSIIHERKVTLLEDGTSFSDMVTLECQLDSGELLTFYILPDSLFDIVKTGITNMSQVNEGDTTLMTEEQIILKRRVVAFMRAATKAMLVGCGDMLLTLFLGKDHPKPPKAHKGEKFDIVDWYMDIFTKIGISYMMKNDTVLKGTLSHSIGREHVYTVFEVGARPVAKNASTDTTDTN